MFKVTQLVDGGPEFKPGQELCRLVVSPGPPLTDARTALASHSGSSSSSNPFGFRAGDGAGPGPWNVELHTETLAKHIHRQLAPRHCSLLVNVCSVYDLRLSCRLETSSTFYPFQKALAASGRAAGPVPEDDVPTAANCRGGRIRTFPSTVEAPRTGAATGAAVQGGRVRVGRMSAQWQANGPSERGRPTVSGEAIAITGHCAARLASRQA